MFEPNVALGRTINCPLLNVVAFIVPICPAALPNFTVPKSNGPFTLIIPLLWISTLSIYAFGPFIVIAPAESWLAPSFLFFWPTGTPGPRLIVPSFFITPPEPASIPVPVLLFTLIVPVLSTTEPKST